MELHLKPETESRLQELAATTGRAPDELVEDAMTGYLAELTRYATCWMAATMTLRAAVLSPSTAKRPLHDCAKRTKTAAVHEWICSPSRSAHRP